MSPSHLARKGPGRGDKIITNHLGNTGSVLQLKSLIPLESRLEREEFLLLEQGGFWALSLDWDQLEEYQ